MTGYPKANRAVQWFLGRVETDPMGPVEKVVWHTTETTSWPSYSGGATAPHYTVKANFTTKRMEWRQHFPDEHNARALQNAAGGVQTNRDGALQVEIVGTCNQTPGAPSWADDEDVLRSWDLEPWQVEGLAEFVVYAHREHGVPLRAPSLWLAYGKDPRRPGVTPASYGDSPARFTGAQWDRFRGHCGHQHVDENDHGDPGAFPIGDVFAVAEAILTPDTDPLEELMALDPKDRAALLADQAAAVWDTPRALTPSTAAELGTTHATGWQLLNWAAASAKDAREAVARVEADLADGVRVEGDDTPPPGP